MNGGPNRVFGTGTLFNEFIIIHIRTNKRFRGLVQSTDYNSFQMEQLVVFQGENEHFVGENNSISLITSVLGSELVGWLDSSFAGRTSGTRFPSFAYGCE